MMEINIKRKTERKKNGVILPNRMRINAFFFDNQRKIPLQKV